MTETSDKAGLLRDLTHDAFVDRYGGDRFTANLLASRFNYVVRRMCANLLYNAFSPILRDSFDFAATVSGPPELDYPMCAVSESLLVFTGPMADAVRIAVEEYGAENLEPGDVLMVNDPYRVGNHVNDLTVIRPVFHQDRIISFLVMRAHQMDMGGITPGGFNANKRNVYESGLVIPPTLLYRKDKPVKSAFNLILDNARFGAWLLPDLKSLYQGLRMGEDVLIDTIERYGADAYLGSMRYVCDVSAEALARAIERKLPDGTFEDEVYVDADGVDESQGYRIKIKIIKAGPRIEVDFSGTSRQARTAINCGPLDAKAAVVVALKVLLDHKTPFTSGSFRPVDIVLPAGTLASATPADGAVFFYWETSMPIVTAVHRALEKALGADAIGGDAGPPILHNCSGYLKDGRPWVAGAQGSAAHGAWGASSAGDGDSCQVQRMMNLIDGSVESAERDAPLVQLRREYVADSSGIGFNRGGAAIMLDNMWLESGSHISTPLHVKTAAGFGANGGGSGSSVACWLFRADKFDVVESSALLPVDATAYQLAEPVGGMIDESTNQVDPAGTYRYFGRRSSWDAESNSIFRYLSAGGGGWGDPLRRDPQRVMRDVRDEYVTVEGALRDYGVVIKGDPHFDPENLVVDMEATNAARRLRAMSGA